MDIFALNNAFFKRYVFVLASNREVGCFFINGSVAIMEKVLAMIDALGCRVVIIDKQPKIFE